MSSWSLTLGCGPEDRDVLIADLWESGTTGITEEENWLRAFFDDTADRPGILERFAMYHPTVEEDEPLDWVQFSQSMWKPFAVGERFWLTPEWVDDPAPEGRLRLPMRPGMASGSGIHAATQLCLMALEKTVEPGARVLDAGTGSGILAEAAQLLGAAFVVGCDIDDEAARIARRNVPAAAFYTGSLRSLRPGSFDLVVANLNPATIATLAKDLQSVAGQAIVSGFKEEEAPRVEKLLRRDVKERLELDGWMCLIC